MMTVRLEPPAPPSRVKHHYNQIFYQYAGAGASSTSVGPLLGNLLAARIADLTQFVDTAMFVLEQRLFWDHLS